MIKIKHFLIDLQYGIQNIIKWWGLIWRDRDWDYSYIYDLLEFKLNNMYKAFSRTDSFGVIHHSHLKRLRVATLLLDRINKDRVCERDLATSVFRPYDIKAQLEELMSRVLHHNDVVSVPSTFEKRRLFSKYLEHMQYLEKQDIQMLHDLMRKYHKYWWD